MSDFLTLPQSATLHLESGFSIGWVPDSSNVLTGQIQGWHGSAPMKRNKSQRLGAHGTYAERGWKDERLIIVPGAFVGPSRASAAATLDQLAGYLGDGLDGIFEVNDANVGLRWASVYLADSGFDPKWKGKNTFTYDLHLMATDPRKYGSTLVVPNTGIPVVSGGLQTEPLMGMGTRTLSRTNLCTNPGFEVDLTSWSMVGPGSVARDTTQFSGGVASMKAIWATVAADATAARFSMNVTAGTTYTFSADVFVPAGQPAVNILIGAGVEARSAASTVTGSWQRLSATVTSTVTASAYFDLRTVGASVAGQYAYIDNVLIEQAATAGSYFDGNTPRSSTLYYSWTAAANASTSTAETFASVPDVLDFGTAGTPGTATLSNIGTADTGPVFTITGTNVPGFTITEITTGRRLVFTDTIQTGQTLVINTDNGTVTLDGYADRRSKLTVAQWTRLGPGQSGTWLFESPGSIAANMKVEVTPAWW